MMVFAIRIEHPLDVTVQGSHDADARAQAIPAAPVLNQISRQPGLLDDQRGPLQDRNGR
jgi:hypothetical protein